MTRRENAMPRELPNAQPRAFVLLKSGRRINLLDPDPDAWTDQDLAAGLARTARWAGSSKWPNSLSVAQHSLTVLALREAQEPLSAEEALRELLHDATEFLLGWDCIAPIKAALGEPFRTIEANLQRAVDRRYRLPAWEGGSYRRHKWADRLAAASEAYHVVGWSRQEMRDALGIATEPLANDPLPPTPGFAPWEPWPATIAEALFRQEFERLLRGAERQRRGRAAFKAPTTEDGEAAHVALS